VAPGQKVTAGQALLRFDIAPLTAEIAVGRARCAQLEQRREDLELEIARLSNGIHPAEQVQARREAERAQLTAQDAQNVLSRSRELADAGLTAAEALQKAELDNRLATLAAEEKTAAVPLLAGRQSEAIAALRKEIDTLSGDLAAERIEVAEKERRVAQAVVVAPEPGLVAGPQLFELAKQYVEEGVELLRLERGAPARFEGWLNDHGRSAVSPGQKVKIRVDGLPWLLHGTVPGRVEVVGGQRAVGDGGEGFPVVVMLTPDSGPGPLADGMAGQARIGVNRRVSLGRLLFERLLGADRP
jgi:multidrug resistance efflux pump